MTVPVPTPLANNPAAPRVLKQKQQTHQQKTRCNNHGSLPTIVQMQFLPPLPLFTEIKPTVPTIPSRSTNSTATPQQSHRLSQMTLPCMQQTRIISQEAIYHLVPTKCDRLNPQQQNLEYYAMLVVHPITGEHITSYHCLMLDPLTSKVWMTAFEKDFGSMAQGDEKTGTKGTNAMFVMNPKDIPHIPKKSTTNVCKGGDCSPAPEERSQSCLNHSWRKFN